MRSYDHSKRERVISLYQSGEKRVKISDALGISYYTVLNWIKRYEEHGEEGLKVQYSNCGRKMKLSSVIKKRAISLKRDHEEWGSDYILMQLKKEYPDAELVSSRQLRRYFKQAGLAKELVSKLPKVSGSDSWASHEFYRVQVDAKEQIRTQDGNWCSYLTFTDEKSGAVLDAFVFPPQVYSSGFTYSCV
jgi:transposase